jgi:hypothetical protein
MMRSSNRYKSEHFKESFEMRGQLIDAWDQALVDIWAPLYEQEGAPLDLFASLYPELARTLLVAPTEDDLLTVSNDAGLSRQKFFETRPADFASEFSLTRFWQSAYEVLSDTGPDSLVTNYESMTRTFLDRYNLRYRIVSPYRMVPRLPALLGGMIEEVELRISSDPDLCELHQAAELAFEDLSTNGRPVDIRNCIARVCNFAEGLAIRMPGVTEKTLGAATKQMKFWPHATVRNALTSLYGFCSDYPAIRHGAKSDGKLRDALIISMALLGFTGYLTELDFEKILGIKAST